MPAPNVPPMRSHWIKAAAVLAAVWLVVGGIIFWARSTKATPESVTRYVETVSLDGKSPKDRKQILEKVADQLNKLEYEQRREMRMGRKLDGFFRALTPDEQAQFLERTLPTGFKQMMDALNKMEPDKRKKFVSNALEEMKKREGERPPDENFDANAQKIMDQGFRTFYSEASAEVKMDVAPLIEQMQKNLQSLR